MFFALVSQSVREGNRVAMSSIKTENKTYSPLAVANTIIRMIEDKEIEVNHMKLQKLVYLCYCWWLAKNDEPFISEEPQVWKYGPVFYSLYSVLRSFGGATIKEPQQAIYGEEPPFVGENEKAIEDVIEWVIAKYGEMTGTKLSELTHEVDSPWHIMAKKHNFKVPLYLAIDKEVIKSRYRQELQV